MAYADGMCRVCGEPLDDARRRYCEDHAADAKREAGRQRWLRWDQRNGHVEESLGTGSLGEHRDPDFEKEARLVSEEMARLGLRKRR